MFVKTPRELRRYIIHSSSERSEASRQRRSRVGIANGNMGFVLLQADRPENDGEDSMTEE